MRVERHEPLRRVLAACFPEAIMPSGAPKKPLRLDIFGAIVAVMPEIDRDALRKFLLSYIQKPSYLEALAAEGAMRHDLEGVPVEPVSAGHRAGALDRLAMRVARATVDPVERRRAENAKRKARRRKAGKLRSRGRRASRASVAQEAAAAVCPEAAE